MTTEIDMTEGLVKHKQPEFHFLLTNAFEWRSGDDLHIMMKEMDKLKYVYWVWYVPEKEGQKYTINFYRPQVEGSFVLTIVDPKAKAKRK
jgi:hypothetical protein